MVGQKNTGIHKGWVDKSQEYKMKCEKQSCFFIDWVGVVIEIELLKWYKDVAKMVWAHWSDFCYQL